MNINDKCNLVWTFDSLSSSCMNFFKADGQVEWVEIWDYLFSCDYLFCLHDSKARKPDHPVQLFISRAAVIVDSWTVPGLVCQLDKSPGSGAGYTQPAWLQMPEMPEIYAN